MFKRTALILSLMICSPGALAQPGVLKHRIEQLLAGKKADVGVAIYGLESRETILIRDRRYPMQSVFKLPVALAVLDGVDRGRLSLDQQLTLTPSDLLPDTWSPLRDEYPGRHATVSLDKVLRYTVSQSDNNGCDVLLRLLGGPRVVDRYIRALGGIDMQIRVNEADMHRDDSAQYRNWTTPSAANRLLADFYHGKMLSQKSRDYLWQIMTETSSGKDRIKGRLPAGTVVAHKTGTSGGNSRGIYAATNDIGIVVLPDGRHFAISVFVANSRERNEANARMIADIARLAWDYFTARPR